MLHYLWYQFLVNFPIALLFFFVGLLIGWLLWRHCHEDAAKIEARNERLQEEYDELRDEHEEASSLN